MTQDPILLMAVAAGGGMSPLLTNLLLFAPIIILFYFLLIRPQQQRMKAHQAMVAGIKRGDTIVLSSGMIAKVTRVEADEVMAEIAQGVNVRVVKAMITEVRDRTAPAAIERKKGSKA